MKFIKLLMVSALVVNMPLAYAEESPHEIRSRVTLATEYLFRGFSRSNEDPAIQGGVDYTYKPMGIYAGVRASNVEFRANRARLRVDSDGDPILNEFGEFVVTQDHSDDSSIELDFYSGMTGEYNDLGWDLGGRYVFYPGTDEDDDGDYDYFEAFGNVGYDFTVGDLQPSVKGGLAWSPDYFREDGHSIYTFGSVDVALPLGFGVSSHLGYFNVEGDKTLPDGYSYVHWQIGANYSAGGFDLGLSYFNAEDDCHTGRRVDEDLCEGVLFSVSRGM